MSVSCSACGGSHECSGRTVFGIPRECQEAFARDHLNERPTGYCAEHNVVLSVGWSGRERTCYGCLR